MKKIVGIIAAVAMAASVFALDFSGAMKVQPNLFKIDLDTEDYSVFADNGMQGGGMYYNTRFQAAIYADKAGLQFAVAPSGAFGDWALWIQPIDQLKIQFGYARASLFQCFRDQAWGRSFSSYNYGDGYKIELNIEGLSVTAILGQNKANAAVAATLPENKLSYGWMSNNNAKVIFDTLGYIKYSIDDVGTFGVAALYQNEALKLVAGYGNKFGDIDMFVQGGVTVLPEVTNVFGEVQVQATLDTVSLPVFVRYENTLKSGDFMANNDITVFFKPSIAFDSAKVYLDVIANDLLSDPFGDLTIQPGVEFNIGAASCDLGVKIEIKTPNIKNYAPFGASTTKISVPFAITVGM